MGNSYNAEELRKFAERLLRKIGLDAEKAGAVATVLLEADLLGHTTHGLQLLSPYLDELQGDRMAKDGLPETLADLPAAIAWHGRRLPGPWLVTRALDLAVDRARVHGTCTVSIRGSHHIGCLAAYLKRVTDRGMMAILASSDPWVKGVAPHGGRRGAFTPDPLAAAWPTDGDPVIIDVSMSITTHGLVKRLHSEGGRLPGKWLIDQAGKPTDDPAVMFAEPPGALLPIGGIDHGHKGYALALMIEALTSGLAGHGRADPSEGWGANVFAQVLNPELFGGSEPFARQTAWIAAECRRTPPREGFSSVRLPGESGLRRREAQLANGVDLYPGIMASLEPWARKLGVAPPKALPAIS